MIEGYEQSSKKALELLPGLFSTLSIDLKHEVVYRVVKWTSTRFNLAESDFSVTGSSAWNNAPLNWHRIPAT